MPIIMKKIPELGIEELIYGTLIEGDLFTIQEIPFLSSDLNYHDVVQCKKYLPDAVEGYHDFIKVIKSGGYQTVQIAFNSGILLEEKKKIIKDLSNLGVRYRRSGLSSFSFSLAPGRGKTKALEYIDQLFRCNVFIKDDRKDIGAVANITAVFGYYSRPPVMNDGMADDEELEYYAVG